MRHLASILSFLVAVLEISTAPTWALALPGESLETATKEDFFTFFHLQKRALDERDNLNTHYFRPQSKDNLVVCVDTTKEGVILQMSLIVDRNFINDPKTNPFARDIVKSFLEAATPAKDADQTNDLVNEIFFRNTKLTEAKVDSVSPDGKERVLEKDEKVIKLGEGELKKGDVITLVSGDIPKLPENESDAFRAFEGKLEDCDLPLSTSHVIMRNHQFPKGQFLEVRVDVNGVKKEPKFEVIEDDAPEAPKKEK